MDVLVMVSLGPVYQSLFKHLVSLVQSAVFNVMALVPNLSKQSVSLSEAYIKDRFPLIV